MADAKTSTDVSGAVAHVTTTRLCAEALFEKLQAMSAASGFLLLDTKWRGSDTKHRFTHMASGKPYEGRPSQLMGKTGFPKGCPKNVRSKSERLDALACLAANNGFLLLETKWLGSGKKHRFTHVASGKEYSWAPHQLMRHVGFPTDLRKAAHSAVESFTLLRARAKENGFVLLETEWLGSKKKHRFTHVASGKPYAGRPFNLMGKAGFPKDLRNDSERLDALACLAANNGFTLLETKWLGFDKKHRFIHKASGKEYSWVPNHVMGRAGFPKDLRSALDRYQELRLKALKHGFALLETEWLGAAVKHRFKHLESTKEYAWTPDNLMDRGPNKDLPGRLDRFTALAAYALKKCV